MVAARFSIWLDESLQARARRYAERNGTSVSHIIACGLRERLDMLEKNEKIVAAYHAQQAVTRG